MLIPVTTPLATIPPTSPPLTVFRLRGGEVSAAGETEPGPGGGCGEAGPGGQPLHQALQPGQAPQDPGGEPLSHGRLSGDSEKSTCGDI